MSKRVLGYAKPPYAIVDFASIIYTDDDDKFIAETDDYRVTSFIPVYKSQPVEDIHVNKRIAVSGDAYYCYIPPAGKPIHGEFAELKERLYELLFSTQLNPYAKLSLAEFFKLWGKKKHYISVIVKERRQSDPGFHFIEAKSPFIELTGATQAAKLSVKVDYWKAEMARTNDKISWRDILLIEKEQLFIDYITCTVAYFNDMISDGKDVLKVYLMMLPFDELYKLRLQSDTIYKITLDQPLKLLTDQEAAAITEFVEAPYEMEQDLSKQATTRPVKSIEPADVQETPVSMAELKKFKVEIEAKKKHGSSVPM